MNLLKEFGFGGAVGAVAGVAAVVWVDPTTPGGTALIVIVCAVAGAAVARLVNWLKARGA
ncbi:MAG: hypothetical protein WD270_13160 [Acetobacterales bacterium]